MDSDSDFIGLTPGHQKDDFPALGDTHLKKNNYGEQTYAH